MRLAFALVITLCFTSSAHAWSTKEHIVLTHVAVIRLLESPQTPPEMKAWLKSADTNAGDLTKQKDFFLHARVGSSPKDLTGLPHFAVLPDVLASTNDQKVEPFDVRERLLHFIDLEYFITTENRRVYADDLSNKPRLADIPKDIKDWRFARAGMLPFRVEQCYTKLVESIRAESRDGAGKDDAVQWAGFLAHYLADNTQPQHATIDYKSHSYFKNPQTAPNVHGDMEYRLVDEEFEGFLPIREALWDAFMKALDKPVAPVTSPDPWQSTVEISLFSYDALPLIGKAAVAAYGPDGAGPFDAKAFAYCKGKFGGGEMTLLDMKARQLAIAVQRIESLWLAAWREAKSK